MRGDYGWEAERNRTFNLMLECTDSSGMAEFILFMYSQKKLNYMDLKLQRPFPQNDDRILNLNPPSGTS